MEIYKYSKNEDEFFNLLHIIEENLSERAKKLYYDFMINPHCADSRGEAISNGMTARVIRLLFERRFQEWIVTQRQLLSYKEYRRIYVISDIDTINSWESEKRREFAHLMEQKEEIKTVMDS